MKIVQKNIEIAPRIAVSLIITPIIRTLDALTCSINYRLLSETGEILQSEMFELTEAQYAGWGYDNNYLEDIVLTRLGLTRLEE